MLWNGSVCRVNVATLNRAALWISRTTPTWPATCCASEPPTLATVPPDVFITHLETNQDPVSEEEKSFGTTSEPSSDSDSDSNGDSDSTGESSSKSQPPPGTVTLKKVWENTSLALLWLAQAWVFVFVRKTVATLNPVAIAKPRTKKSPRRATFVRKEYGVWTISGLRWEWTSAGITSTRP